MPASTETPLWVDMRLRFAQEDGLPIVLDDDALNESIRNILFTRKQDRFFNRTFASDLEELVFEPIDDLTAQLLLSRVVILLSSWEPRIQVDLSRSSVTALPDDNQYNVNIRYVKLDTQEIGQFIDVISTGKF
jgi:phage baseplate assembly protein W